MSVLTSNKNFLPTLSDVELKEKFSNIKPRMANSEAIVEASRCLFCHDAPCINACPTSIDIPMFIRQIMSKNTKGAAKTIFTQNILGKSCAHVCPTEVLCEGACVYNNLNEKPIDIGRLQAFATDYAVENNLRFFKKGKSTGKKIAVIGGGPSGLACAHELTVLGHEVVVYEANEKAGGLNTYGVAPYKYSNKDSEEEVKYIAEIGFEVKTNCPVTGATIPELEKKYDAIFIGAGLGKSKKLGIAGEDLESVHGATEFIHKLRKKEQKIQIGKTIVIVGGGNTAIDAAVESSKLGADVTVVYRRTEKEQKAYYFEVELAKKHNVKFIYLTNPVSILGNEFVEGLKCIQNTNGGQKDLIIPCDMVIFATGQEKIIDFYKSIKNLEVTQGKIVVNKNFQTTNPKYFAGGDCINGGKEVVNAAAHGRDAARGINEFLMRGHND
ncbi:MAG: NAD(P)-dependent oxidoreductase [Candidatus Melainabacteria bacterium]|nr:NAD(P)-dependent oxidoreductase [Candidatus Melainabacteria bacterium]